MPHQRLLRSVISFLWLLAVSACSSTLPTATPTFVPLKAPTATPFSTLVSTSSSVLWTADFTPTISIAAMGRASHEEIIQALYTQYLDHYKNSRANDQWRLDDYEIRKIDASRLVEAQINSGAFDFVGIVIYSVKPSVFLYSRWNAGNGETGENGWIRNKANNVGVVTRGETYQLQLLGTG